MWIQHSSIPRCVYLLFFTSFTLSAAYTPPQPSLGYGTWPTDIDNRSTGDTQVVCGGLSAFFQCGDNFPASFCCPQTTYCLKVNGSSNVFGTLCCPEGSVCGAITPLSCDVEAQNATLTPQSQYHVVPPTVLETCGSKCCPVDYTCVGGGCYAPGKAPTSTQQAWPATSTTGSATQGSTSTTQTQPTTSTAGSVPKSTSSTGQQPTDTAGTSIQNGAVVTVTSVPSQASVRPESIALIVVGTVLALAACAGVIFFLRRRRKRRANVTETSKADEAHRSMFLSASEVAELHGDHRLVELDGKISYELSSRNSSKPGVYEKVYSELSDSQHPPAFFLRGMRPAGSLYELP